MFLLRVNVVANLQKKENPFETDTKGRLFVVDVSINWPSDGNGQTEVLDSWWKCVHIVVNKTSP